MYKFFYICPKSGFNRGKWRQFIIPALFPFMSPNFTQFHCCHQWFLLVLFYFLNFLCANFWQFFCSRKVSVGFSTSPLFCSTKSKCPNLANVRAIRRGRQTNVNRVLNKFNKFITKPKFSQHIFTGPWFVYDLVQLGHAVADYCSHEWLISCWV